MTRLRCYRFAANWFPWRRKNWAPWLQSDERLHAVFVHGGRPFLNCWNHWHSRSCQWQCLFPMPYLQSPQNFRRFSLLAHPNLMIIPCCPTATDALLAAMHDSWNWCNVANTWLRARYIQERPCVDVLRKFHHAKLVQRFLISKSPGEPWTALVDCRFLSGRKFSSSRLVDGPDGA